MPVTVQTSRNVAWFNDAVLRIRMAQTAGALGQLHAQHWLEQQRQHVAGRPGQQRRESALLEGELYGP